MKQLRILLLFVATITLFSCSSGSDDGTGGGGGGSSTAYTSLTMISTKTTVAVGDYITYVSKGNNTTDVSSQAKLYIFQVTVNIINHKKSDEIFFENCKKFQMRKIIRLEKEKFLFYVFAFFSFFNLT